MHNVLDVNKRIYISTISKKHHEKQTPKKKKKKKEKIKVKLQYDLLWNKLVQIFGQIIQPLLNIPNDIWY